MRLLITFIIFSLFNCSSKSQTLNEKDNSSYKSITYSIVSLDGEDKIYEIKNDSIFTFDLVIKLDSRDKEQISKIPNLIYQEDLKYGCGVCIDGIDYKFTFDFGDDIKTMEVMPGFKDIPSDIKNYVDTLLRLHNRQMDQD